MWYKDYDEASRAAQAKANRTKCHVRIKKTSVYGKHGYSINLVPHPDKQFGYDLQGEMVSPEPSR